MDDNSTNDPGSAAIAESYTPALISSEPDFTKAEVKGVGGWLLLFVIGQLALRPMLFFASFLASTARADVAERFPATARIITIEATIQIALLIGGIIVGVALLKTGVRWPVLLTKIYLVANALLNLALAVVYFGSDLPEFTRTSLIVKGIISGVVVSIVCLLWFMYFTRSKRVQATYFAQH
jgi:Protein of unknown function (DUF2569)